MAVAIAEPETVFFVFSSSNSPGRARDAGEQRCCPITTGRRADADQSRRPEMAAVCVCVCVCENRATCQVAGQKATRLLCFNRGDSNKCPEIDAPARKNTTTTRFSVHTIQTTPSPPHRHQTLPSMPKKTPSSKTEPQRGALESRLSSSTRPTSRTPPFGVRSQSQSSASNSKDVVNANASRTQDAPQGVRS